MGISLTVLAAVISGLWLIHFAQFSVSLSCYYMSRLLPLPVFQPLTGPPSFPHCVKFFSPIWTLDVIQRSGGQSFLKFLEAKIFEMILYLATNICANIAYEYKLSSVRIIKENVIWINLAVSFLYIHSKRQCSITAGSEHSGARLLGFESLLCHFPAIGSWVS